MALNFIQFARSAFIRCFTPNSRIMHHGMSGPRKYLLRPVGVSNLRVQKDLLTHSRAFKYNIPFANNHMTLSKSITSTLLNNASSNRHEDNVCSSSEDKNTQDLAKIIPNYHECKKLQFKAREPVHIVPQSENYTPPQLEELDYRPDEFNSRDAGNAVSDLIPKKLELLKMQPALLETVNWSGLKLNETELKALNEYHVKKRESFNLALKNGVISAEDQELDAQLQNIFKKVLTVQGRHPYPTFTGHDYDSYKNIKVGDTFSYPGYLSTSRYVSILRERLPMVEDSGKQRIPGMFNFSLKEGTIFVITSDKGLNLELIKEKISDKARDGMREVVHNKNDTFHITKVEDYPELKTRIVFMTENNLYQDKIKETFV